MLAVIEAAKLSRHPDVGFMTRNNLTDHLSWLLNNITLCQPTTPPFSTTVSPEYPQIQFSQLQTASVPVPTSRSRQRDTNNLRNRASAEVNGLRVRGNAVQDTEEVVAVDGNMGRLTSTTKSKKPSLFSKQEQLPTPDSGDARLGDSRATALFSAREPTAVCTHGFELRVVQPFQTPRNTDRKLPSRPKAYPVPRPRRTVPSACAVLTLKS